MTVVKKLWPTINAAIVTFGIVHFSSWLRDRRLLAQLAFAGVTTTVAISCIFEFAMLRAETAKAFACLQRVEQVPIFFMTLALVGYTQLRLKPRRLWPAAGAIGIFLGVLCANFITGASIHYRHTDEISHISFLNSTVTVIAAGVTNPWFKLITFANLALVGYMSHAFLARMPSEQNQRTRKSMLVVEILLICSTLALVLQNPMVTEINLKWPYAATLPGLIVIGLMGYELREGVLRAGQLQQDLHAADLRLRDSFIRAEQIAQTAGFGTWELDFARDEAWMMDSTRALLGIASTGRTSVDTFLHALRPNDDKSLRDVWRLELEREENYIDQEERIRSSEKGERRLQFRGGIDPDMRKLRVMRGCLVDVTQRSMAEERFRQVVECSPTGIIILDAGGRIELVNSRFESDFGYFKAEMIGQPLEAILAERSRRLMPTVQNGRLCNASSALGKLIETIGQRRDGSEMPISLVFNSIQMPYGSSMIVNVQDFSERVRHLRQLEHERALLRQVIDITPNLLYAKDYSGRFTLANQTVADMHGMTVEALIGKTGNDVHGIFEHINSFVSSDATVMPRPSEQSVLETQVTDASGNTHWLQIIKRPILRKNGESDQVLVSAVDITLRKRTDLELARQRNELVHLTRVTMVSELSASIAHELNQPLTAILANAQAASRFLAVEAPDLQEVREILLDVASDGRRAGEVIQGLRLMLQKGEHRREHVDLNKEVHEVLRLLCGEILSAGVQLTTDLASGLPEIFCDRVQLQQVLLNLLLNSCDAMKQNLPSERRLTIATADVDGNFVSASISDQGHGLAPAEMTRVFEPFFSTKVNGLGLGLSISSHIVSAHGGRLWAKNNAVRGSTFTFTLSRDSSSDV